MAFECALRRNLILIGCGPHYQVVYHAVLERLEARLVILVDLECRRSDIENYFQHKILKPHCSLFLDDDCRHTLSPERIDLLLSPYIEDTSIDGILLCVEPKAKKPYALWAIHQGFPIFMDKPISAFHGVEGMQQLYEDYQQILEAAEQREVDVVVCCERRAHIGYLWVRDYLSRVLAETQVPITGIDIYCADGKLSFPFEFPLKENHPYKYGYGILLHTGLCCKS